MSITVQGTPTAQLFRRGFTLVELLAVIAIISVLAAMLLPTVESSLDQARRMRCLGERRQFGLAFSGWGNDHRDRVPTRISRWQNQNNRTPDTQVAYLRGGNTSMSRGDDGGCTAYDLGLMAHYGYVENPSLFFCPDFQRSGAPNAGLHWDTAFPDVWQRMRDPAYLGYFGGVYSIAAGVSNCYMVAGPWGADIWTRGYTKENLTFGYLAEHWAASTGVSPILQTCANEVTWPNPRPAYTDSAGVTRAEVSNYGPFAGGERASHALAGLSAVFVDGSGRWIPEREVTWMPSTEGTLLATHYRLLGNLHVWARAKATIAPPRN